MNKIYYFEVLVDNLSICIDSEVAYYHYFKKGDIIEYYYKKNYINLEVSMIKINVGEFLFDRFVVDWDKIHSWSSSLITEFIEKGMVADVTKQVERDQKLKQLDI
jgi:hypothetical protein